MSLVQYMILVLLTILAVYLFQTGSAQLSALFHLFSIGVYMAMKYVNDRKALSANDVVVITGCDSGLGYSLALHCSSLGAKVIAGVHNETSVGAQKLLSKKIVVSCIEVTDSKSVSKFSEKVKQYLEENTLNLRCVVNNVGSMVFGEFEWQTEEQISHQVNVNLLGTMRMTSKLLPLARAHSSRLIFVLSHSALEAMPGVSVYSAAKAALLAFATSLRVEQRKYGVEVVSFVPGSFVTESNIFSKQNKHFEDMKAGMSDEVKNFYEEYFDRWANTLEPLSQKHEPQMLSTKQIFQKFEGAILDVFPSTIYTSETCRFKFCMTLFKFLPTRVRDVLITKFIGMPEWKKE